ncbi:glycosyl hydrolases family 31-domain-containing protein [Terfezia claveryi]|nr:glycosyl hydrolases family 31-domain-containing protein [Terfezia claveryi]
MPYVTPGNRAPIDGHTFILPEDFFAEKNLSSFTSPDTCSFNPSDNDPRVVPAVTTGAIFRLCSHPGPGALLLVQFVRPNVWRIRFDPTKKTANEYTDFNSRTVIIDTLAALRKHLDEKEGTVWETVLGDVGQFFSLQSINYPSEGARQAKNGGKTVIELRVYKKSLRIEAIREIEEYVLNIPSGIEPVRARKIVWSTPAGFLAFKTVGTAQNIVLTTNKPGPARYLGFGEQGGQQLLKRPTLMNYFNFDNMTYSSVYGIGPKDEREPLYHSEPYWLELGGIPGYRSQVSTFVDNYSQVLVDFLTNNSGQIKAATRFGELQYFVFAGDGAGEIITSLTNIIGKSRLKPRYALGHHQGCYGYDTREKVLKVGQNYVDRDIPLDAIHIDVDIQDNYRSFTIDVNGKFPRPDTMFSELREKGIVCATNITPVVNNSPSTTYKTFRDGLTKGYFIPDVRYNEFGNGPTPYHEVEYVCYENGVKWLIDPINEVGQFPGASYDLPSNYNSGKAYRGGVSYGGALGAPGYYLDLNVKAIREFWGRQYQYLFKQGLEFIWQDMTTPAIAKEYGDQKGLPFRLMITDDTWEAEASGKQVKKPAIEVWALYSYNLHKATYEGLNKLPIRENKRNFIIGRGSFAGQHRYAGLWTGDNASTWDHFQISVCQVLAIGLSGNELVGADVGGFMPAYGHYHLKWADPELLVRWYCAYSLLPWFRNHYHGKRGMKLFQEPWAYTDYFRQNIRSFEEHERYSWLAVEPACRYYVKLRYSLMQLLYDAMFEHQFNGLPIARALVITDTMDTTLLGENDWCLDNEYMVRKDLLVCPVMRPLKDAGGGREVYLPRSTSWYSFNLGIEPGDRLPGRRLGKKLRGGDRFFLDAHISADTAWMPKICPMFVREGGIIPQISPRQSMTLKNGPNPITIHFYPSAGIDNSYSMYLDDGVSRSSAPRATIITDHPDADIDPAANSEYREVHFHQQIIGRRRTVTMTIPHDGYGPQRVKKDIGDMLTFVLWHEPGTSPDPWINVTGARCGEIIYLHEVGATTVKVPVDIVEVEKGKLIIAVTYK